MHFVNIIGCFLSFDFSKPEDFSKRECGYENDFDVRTDDLTCHLDVDMSKKAPILIF